MLAIAERAARAAGAIIQQRSATRVDHKGAVDLVTEVDLARPWILATNTRLHGAMIEVLAGLDEELALPR